MAKQRAHPVVFGPFQDTLFSVTEMRQAAIWLTKAELPAATTFPSGHVGYWTLGVPVSCSRTTRKRTEIHGLLANWSVCHRNVNCSATDEHTRAHTHTYAHTRTSLWGIPFAHSQSIRQAPRDHPVARRFQLVNLEAF